MAPAETWKPQTRPPSSVSPNGVLELVAVAPLLQRGHDLLELEAVQVPDSAQRLIDLFALDLQLALVGEDLPGDARMVGLRRYALGTGPQDLDGARVGVGALALVDERTHAIAGDGA